MFKGLELKQEHMLVIAVAGVAAYFLLREYCKQPTHFHVPGAYVVMPDTTSHGGPYVTVPYSADTGW